MLDKIREILQPLGAELLPEIHEHYSISQKIAAHDYFVYDFALPMIVLYTLYSGKTERLAEWLRISPMKQFTTLDAHEEIDYTSEHLYRVGANVKRKYSSAAYNNLDIYQINSTYYSALGNDDATYLLSRVFQVFAPGTPQIYYVGLFAGENDIALLESSIEGRNINRHYFTKEEVAQEVERPIVEKLLNLLKWRNISPAFDLEGSISIETPTETSIQIIR